MNNMDLCRIDPSLLICFFTITTLTSLWRKVFKLISFTLILKAFDNINHSILLNKLSSFGGGDPLLNWLSNFIINRNQLIRFNNSFSRNIEVSSGVLQGSHFDPLLFNIFINDISNVFKYSKFLLYADDLKIFRRVRTVENVLCQQRDLDDLNSWSKINKLYFNISKCHVVLQ